MCSVDIRQVFDAQGRGAKTLLLSDVVIHLRRKVYNSVFYT